MLRRSQLNAYDSEELSIINIGELVDMSIDNSGVKYTRTKVTWHRDDTEVVKSTTRSSPVAVQIKPKELNLNSFFEVEGLKSGCWSSNSQGILKVFLQ